MIGGEGIGHGAQVRLDKGKSSPYIDSCRKAGIGLNDPLWHPEFASRVRIPIYLSFIIYLQYLRHVEYGAVTTVVVTADG